MPDDERLFELRGVERVFRHGATVVRAVTAVDATIDAGELVVLEGPHGSGKTTLLQLLGALDRPTAGELRFAGSDLSLLGGRELADLRRRAFGYVFSRFNLIPTLTAVQNVEAKLAPGGVTGPDSRRQALQLLGEVGLAGRAEHLPAHLSGLDRQRVAVARAVAGDPQVVLADDPAADLDPAAAAALFRLLADVAARRGATVVVTARAWDVPLAARRLRLAAGRLVGGAVVTA
jgi:putative ABC transport system ATP-binding protein